MSGFHNRVEAGRLLAEVLATRDYPDPVVLALPRGGVPLGAQVARKLGAPLDLVMVRKIGVPFQPELAAAAVVNGDHPEIVVNRDVVTHCGMTNVDIEHLAEVQLQEIKRRRAIYLEDRPNVSVKGKTAIIVDDGIATGATVRAALKAVRRQKPAKLILAIPVAPAETLKNLQDAVDEIVCLETPDFFHAIGAHYANFDQVLDDEVVRIMADVSTMSVENDEKPKLKQ